MRTVEPPMSCSEHLLAAIEPKMRSLLPATLYTAAWLDPCDDTLMRVFQHLRTLHHSLNDYVPRQVAIAPPQPGVLRHTRQSGTLLFTDLAGFTPLLEAASVDRQAGALALLEVLNRYFSDMVEIISKSGGDLLEFTGDAMLVLFPANPDGNDTAQAVRAGLRMQRSMAHFQSIPTLQGCCSLGMRVGIHTGEFWTADLGTPLRMVHVLVGKTVQRAKQAEGAGRVGRVCVTRAAGLRLGHFDDAQSGATPAPGSAPDTCPVFQLEPLDQEHWLVCDDLSRDRLGEYDLTPNRRRLSTALLLDRSTSALLQEIEQALDRVEPLATYLPSPILNLLVENAARRRIEPSMPEPVVVFVNLLGLPEAIDQSRAAEVQALVTQFSQVIAQIQAIVRSQGGILQKVTYQSVGSDMLLYFGALECRPDDARRAVEAALGVRDLVQHLPPVLSNEQTIAVSCRIGMDRGPVFAAEMGEPRGRREFNILGDPVNTAARLMVTAQPNQILLTGRVQQVLPPDYPCQKLGDRLLKGKASPIATFTLEAVPKRAAVFTRS